MKVKINKPIYYFGCYQLAEVLCFWVPKVPDPDFIHSDPEFAKIHKVFPEWVSRFGEILDTGSFEKDSNKESLLSKFFQWLHTKRKQKIQVKIDPWDTWSLDCTLSYIILASLKEFKKDLHSYPSLIDHKNSSYIHAVNFDDSDKDAGMKIWVEILDKMIYSFDEKINETNKPEPEFISEGKRIFDYEIKDKEQWYKDLEEYETKVQEGFELFGKYFQNLWN